MTERHQPLSDPKAMRALAHPARLAMLNHLAVVGTATATELAEVVGVSPSAASYHMRMLEKYGFAADAPARSDGRERVWKHHSAGITLSHEPGEPGETRAARDLLVDAIWSDAEREARRALAQVEQTSEEWRGATVFARSTLIVTAEELKGLTEEIEKLVEPFLAKHRQGGKRPEGAQVAEAQYRLFPRAERRTPGLPTEDHDARVAGEEA
ncbi:ArsR/SmtB family transcription factor [Nonomuraea soli]|uniref:DNA-binding transcriptional ArsR family regulator n=1 Tax=Nonomuraea soli TaxID=1032476 RepID=A0A7W0CLC7_9ACTN|nr:helix-turn-helix domain-containing protein [Nonomuraea soli]MBA2893299.1 DNA-binding transcriptional ArsR family regulator [Nonomuraea soli]